MGTRVFHTYPGGGVSLKLDPQGMGGGLQRAHPDPATPPASPPHHLNIQLVLTLCTPGSCDGVSRGDLLESKRTASDLTSPSPRNPSPSAVKAGIGGGCDTHLPPPSRPKEDSEDQSFGGARIELKSVASGICRWEPGAPPHPPPPPTLIPLGGGEGGEMRIQIFVYLG